MLPGKRSDTKLNLLIEESAIEKLSRSKVFLWCITNTRFVGILLAASLVLFLAGAWWFTKKDARFQEQYIKVQNNIEKMQDNLFKGNDKDALAIWSETSPIIKGQTSFIQAFQAKSAELLLLLGNHEEALPLMQSTLNRTNSLIDPSMIPFINVTVDAAKPDITLALDNAKKLAADNESEMPILLRAYNLLQIPTFAKSANDQKEELESINKILSLIEGRGDLGGALLLLSQTIRSERTTYLDYLKERKKVISL